MNIRVRKDERGWWERLTAQERKPVFLSPDFDRWLDESDAEMEIREKVGFLSFSALHKCQSAARIMQMFDIILDLSQWNCFFFKGGEDEQTEGFKV